MTGSGQSHNFLDDKTNTGKGIVIMDRNTTKYKVKQYIMFAGISTVLFAAVVIIPFIYGLYLTFTSWDGISKDKQFVGFANYIATFKDIAYWQALGRTVIYSVISVVLVNVVAFFLAYLLTSGIKGQNFFRAGFFIPNLIGGIVLGYIWQLIFDGIFSKFDMALKLNAKLGFWGLVILICWQQIGYMMIVYIAGLQAIPDSLKEAAMIDGANAWKRLFHVTIPNMMPSITICTFLTITNSFKLFDQNLSLTGGEPLHKTEMLALNIYDTFYGRVGYEGVGQAKAVIFFLAVIVISMLQLRLTRSKEVQQ